MKIKHKNSGEIIDVTEPNYGKHYMSIYGYLFVNGQKVYFIYSIPNIETSDLELEDLSDYYEIVS